MKKILILFLVFCFSVSLGSGGCKGKKQEEKKPATPQTEKAEKKTASLQKTNYAPKIVEAKIVPDPAYANSHLRVEVTTEDPEGDFVELKYQWISFEGSGLMRDPVEINGETGQTLSRDKIAHGDVFAVRITPVDWKGAEGQMYQTKPLLIKNSPPEIISSPPENITGNLYSYPVKVNDLDNDPITFSLSQNAPKGMTIDPATGIVTWKIPSGTTGTITFKVNGDDGHGGTCYQTAAFDVSPAPTPQEGKELPATQETKEVQ